MIDKSDELDKGKFYKSAIQKLGKAVMEFNSHSLKFVVHLGIFSAIL